MDLGSVEAARVDPAQVGLAGLDATGNDLLASAFPVDVDAHLATRELVDLGRERVDAAIAGPIGHGHLERDRRDRPAFLAGLSRDSDAPEHRGQRGRGHGDGQGLVSAVHRCFLHVGWTTRR